MMRSSVNRDFFIRASPSGKTLLRSGPDRQGVTEGSSPSRPTKQINELNSGPLPSRLALQLLDQTSAQHGPAVRRIGQSGIDAEPHCPARFALPRLPPAVRRQRTRIEKMHVPVAVLIGWPILLIPALLARVHLCCVGIFLTPHVATGVPTGLPRRARRWSMSWRRSNDAKRLDRHVRAGGGEHPAL